MPKKIKSIYECFSDFSKQMVDEEIAKLSDEEHEILIKRYGEDLSTPEQGRTLTKEESDIFYKRIYAKIRRHLLDKKIKKNDNCQNRKVKTIYELVGSEYKKEDIDEAISKLPFSQKSFIEQRYGSNLENPIVRKKMTKEEKGKLYGTIVPKIRAHITKKYTNNDEKAKRCVTGTKVKTIYELVGTEYRKEDIDSFINDLSVEHKEIIKLRYGNNLDNPERKMTKTEKNIFYCRIIPKLRSMLAKSKQSEEQKNIEKGKKLQ